MSELLSVNLSSPLRRAHCAWNRRPIQTWTLHKVRLSWLSVLVQCRLLAAALSQEISPILLLWLVVRSG